ncbi:hypothetical protein Hanom_Chr01g00078871 [Helianthus anomalus]
MRLIFLGPPCFFCALRLGPRRDLCALSALSAFNNYDGNHPCYLLKWIGTLIQAHLIIIFSHFRG